MIKLSKPRKKKTINTQSSAQYLFTATPRASISDRNSLALTPAAKSLIASPVPSKTLLRIDDMLVKSPINIKKSKRNLQKPKDQNLQTSKSRNGLSTIKPKALEIESAVRKNMKCEFKPERLSLTTSKSEIRNLQISLQKALDENKELKSKLRGDSINDSHIDGLMANFKLRLCKLLYE